MAGNSFDLELIQQLRSLIREEMNKRRDLGVVEKVGSSTVSVRLSDSGTKLSNIPMVGGVAASMVGDPVYLLHFGDESVVAVNTRSITGGLASGVAVTHNHDDRYYTEAEMVAYLSTKADAAHEHTPDVINALSGFIADFEIADNYIRDRFDSFGLASDISASDDVRFWAGATYADRATAPFRVYKSGAIDATSGVIGGWTINDDYLAKDTGVDATSAGLSPADYPFYAGATYANRAVAPFQALPSGTIQNGNFVSGNYGWRIRYGGDAEFNNISVRGELHTSVLVSDEEHAVGGTLRVRDSATLYEAVTSA